MTNTSVNNSRPGLTVDVALTGEQLQSQGAPDPFPPEGTDDRRMPSQSDDGRPLSDDEATKATHHVIELSMIESRGIVTNQVGVQESPGKPDDQYPYPNDSKGLSPTTKAVCVKPDQ